MIPHAQDSLEELRARRERAGGMLLAFDFDGTLADIVPRPADAALHPSAADALRRLAARADTAVAIISGRALEDVRARVGIGGIYYSGNHGLEIEGPDLQRTADEAEALIPIVSEAAGRLRALESEVPGVEVEAKTLSLSVHYRRAATPEVGAVVRRAVEDVARGHDGLRIGEGKMVCELRPAIDWDKGKAALWLYESLRPRIGSEAPVVFIGDDVTDEDAFVAIRDIGLGILVASTLPARTAATVHLRSVAEVVEFAIGLAAD